MFRPCGEMIRVSQNYKKRKASSSNLKIYKCEFCSQGWHSETEVYYHKRSHYKQLKSRSSGNHFCWTCIKQYRTHEHLITHYKMCHLFTPKDARRVERQIFACNECSCVFFNKNMLIVHMNYMHDKSEQNKRLDCPKCFKKVNLKYVWGHFHFHDMVGLRSCPICFTKFSSWNELQNHMNSHPLNLHCNICGITFDKHNLYTHHLEKHVTKTEINNETIDNDEIESHSVNQFFIPNELRPKSVPYLKLQPYQGLRLQEGITICTLCREICTSYKERKQHILQHYSTQQEQKPTPQYVCSCGEMFLHRILLRQHLTRNKGGEFLHEELSQTDIVHLLSNPDEYALVEVV